MYTRLKRKIVFCVSEEFAAICTYFDDFLGAFEEYIPSPIKALQSMTIISRFLKVSVTFSLVTFIFEPF